MIECTAPRGHMDIPSNPLRRSGFINQPISKLTNAPHDDDGDDDDDDDDDNDGDDDDDDDDE